MGCTLSDFKGTWVDRDKAVRKPVAIQEPAQDLSLKDGQKLTVNLKGMARPQRQEAQPPEGSVTLAPLAPPPVSTGLRPLAPAQQSEQLQSRPSDPGGSDLFTKFASAPPAPSTETPLVIDGSTDKDTLDDIDSFGGFQSNAESTKTATTLTQPPVEIQQVDPPSH